MIRNFTYPLHPTKAQEAVLFGWLRLCCDLYNGAVQERRDSWNRGRVAVKYFDQSNAYTTVRREIPEYGEMPAVIGHSVIRRVEHTFSAFFRRRARGEQCGFPRFRSHHRYRSLRMPMVGRTGKVSDSSIWIPKLGYVKANIYRPVKGHPKVADIVHDGYGRWRVIVMCEMGNAPTKAAVSSAVGIDLGLNSFMVLSDGTDIANPRFARSSRDEIAKSQRLLARRKPGSTSHRRASAQVARIYLRVRNRKLDFARKLACHIVRQYDLIAYEALALTGLAKGRIRKAVSEVAWGTFLCCLISKAESAGKWAVPVNPHGTTQRCSACGAKVMKALNEREHRCDCGFSASRDFNASLNILALGRSVVPSTEVGQPTLPVKDRPLPSMVRLDA